MIYLNNNCTDAMLLVVMMCVTYSSTILCLIIFNLNDYIDNVYSEEMKPPTMAIVPRY